MERLLVILFGSLFFFASPVFAHGGPVFAAMLILVWGVIPLLVISLVVLPLSLLIGRLFQLKRKRTIVAGVVVTILIYLLCLPNMQAIIRWVVDFQYYFD